MRPARRLELDWSKIRTVVFDVDGTLYDGRRLRRAMTWRILGWLAVRPWRLPEILALQAFRRHREELADAEAVQIGRRQYEIATPSKRLRERELRRIVDEWIHRRPLPLLSAVRYPGVLELFEELAASGRTVAVWSDYPVDRKLAALGLSANLTVSAEDPRVDRMKPQPAGLELVLGELGRQPEECLLIGDRDDRDGEAARRLGVPYLLFTPGRADAAHEFADYFEVLATLRQR